jgi:hypothetical protein
MKWKGRNSMILKRVKMKRSKSSCVKGIKGTYLSGWLMQISQRK